MFCGMTTEFIPVVDLFVSKNVGSSTILVETFIACVYSASILISTCPTLPKGVVCFSEVIDANSAILRFVLDELL